MKERENGNRYENQTDKRLRIGYNDLFTTEPVLAEEWQPVNNGDLIPGMVTRGSNKQPGDP